MPQTFKIKGHHFKYKPYHILRAICHFSVMKTKPLLTPLSKLSFMTRKSTSVMMPWLEPSKLGGMTETVHSNNIFKTPKTLKVTKIL